MWIEYCADIMKNKCKSIGQSQSLIGNLYYTSKGKHRFLSVFLTGTLPSPKETIKGNIKTVTEYKIDDDGKKIKVI